MPKHAVPSYYHHYSVLKQTELNNAKHYVYKHKSQQLLYWILQCGLPLQKMHGVAQTLQGWRGVGLLPLLLLHALS